MRRLILLLLLLTARTVWAGPGKINGNESLPASVQTLLYDEQVLHNKGLWAKNAFSSDIDPAYVPEQRPRFPLPYYLIPEQHSNFLTAASLDPAVLSQLKAQRLGVTHYKLFVHPESEGHYKFLQGVFPYVGPDKTEFTASPTSSYRSLVVWNDKKPAARPFIAKVSLDRNVIGSIDRLVSLAEVERSIANQKAFDLLGAERLSRMKATIYPETAGLVLKGVEKFPGQPKKLGGQLIREIPESVLNGTKRYISLSSVMSPEAGPVPMVMTMIGRSGMTAESFVREVLIDGYMKMFEALSLEQGINFEPHSQNLSIETNADLSLTGRWVIRDFGGVWPDIVTMAANDGPVEAYVGDKAQIYKFEQGRANSIASYVFFYRRQVFDMLLDQIAKHDAQVAAQKNDLRMSLNKRFVEIMNQHFNLGLKQAPTMENYISLQETMKQSTYVNPQQLIEATGNKTVDALIQAKQARDQYVELAPQKNGFLSRLISKRRTFITPEVILQTDGKGKVLGFMVLNRSEISLLRTEAGLQPLLDRRIQQRKTAVPLCSRSLLPAA